MGLGSSHVHRLCLLGWPLHSQAVRGRLSGKLKPGRRSVLDLHKRTGNAARLVNRVGMRNQWCLGFATDLVPGLGHAQAPWLCFPINFVSFVLLWVLLVAVCSRLLAAQPRAQADVLQLCGWPAVPARL